MTPQHPNLHSLLAVALQLSELERGRLLAFAQRMLSDRTPQQLPEPPDLDKAA